MAVLDSGVDYVSGINLAGYVNFVDEDEISPIYQDMTGHGTGIASIIAGNGETGIYGVNPEVELYSVKIMDDNNMVPLSRVIQGIYWCIENDMNIINMSFGTAVYSQVLEQAVKDAYDAGILMVAAAGNGSGEVEYPAAFSEVMAVAATSPDAEISDFCNTGEELDVAAPGEKIRVASYFDGTVVTHGTSIAVPHVVGVASLLWEKDLEKSHEFIRQLISCSAKEIEGTDECGLLDAEYAMGIYETFSQNFGEDGQILEEMIPINKKESESFEEVNTDEVYVEGRWDADGHKKTVDWNVSGYTKEEINLIKKGCVFPDHELKTLINKFGMNVQYKGTEETWKGAATNPRWHGKWRKEAGNLTNYITVCELVTDMALDASDVPAYSFYASCGLDEWTYKKIKKDITSLDIKKVLSAYGYSNTPQNRKYFLYGCAIHTITDVFAHSTAEKVNGQYVRIPHAPENRADNKELYSNRHAIACLVGKYALQNLKSGIYTDGQDVNKAIQSVLKNKSPKFRIIDIKKNIEANGWKACNEVTKVNIESSQTKTENGTWAN
ncbi:MAG: S8 family serine peptidase [Lachnospiraceae bacterium]|nr:S8 family serine peptidase [Lachnospiraceae bacterium]